MYPSNQDCESLRLPTSVRLSALYFYSWDVCGQSVNVKFLTTGLFPFADNQLLFQKEQKCMPWPMSLPFTAALLTRTLGNWCVAAAAFSEASASPLMN